MELPLAIITNKEGIVSVNDYDVLVDNLKKHLAKYDYVDFKVDSSNLFEVKDERAFLNKHIKLIDDVRKSKDKEIDSKLAYQSQLKTLVNLMKEKELILANGLNEFDLKEQEIKKKQIDDVWFMVGKPFEFNYDNIWDIRWLNKSFSINEIADIMTAYVDKVDKDLELINAMPYDGKRKAMITKLYQERLDLNSAVAQEAKWHSIYESGDVFTKEEIASASAKSDPIVEDKVYQVTFKVVGTKEQLGQLSNYLKSNNYKYEQIKGGK